MKLNLGCGNKKIAGFVNIDIDASCRPDILGSVDNLDPYCEDQSVEEIVAFDIVEHFDRNTIKDVLNNWLRKLGKGGLLVVRTPDFDRIVSLYSRNGRRQGLLGLFGERFSFPLEKAAWHIYGETDVPGMAHKWIYNKPMIERLLLETGFSKVVFTEEKHLVEGVYRYSGDEGDVGLPDHTNIHLVAIK